MLRPRDLAILDFTTLFWIILNTGDLNNKYHFCFLNTPASQEGIDLYPSRAEDHGVSYLELIYCSFLTMLNDLTSFGWFDLTYFSHWPEITLRFHSMWWGTMEIEFGKLNVDVTPNEEAQWRSVERHLKIRELWRIFAKCYWGPWNINFGYLVLCHSLLLFFLWGPINSSAS